ncbi:MAG TPA: hypothetical protein VNM24_05950, partial [Burkholderiales bacterium]|nr:hypothetical protein [Burkholderiales bacterium]
MSKSIKLFVRMDVRKDSMDVATGEERAGEVRPYGAIGGALRVRHLPDAARPRTRLLGGVPGADPAQQRRPDQDRPARLPEAGA